MHVRGIPRAGQRRALALQYPTPRQAWAKTRARAVGAMARSVAHPVAEGGCCGLSGHGSDWAGQWAQTATTRMPSPRSPRRGGVFELRSEHEAMLRRLQDGMRADAELPARQQEGETRVAGAGAGAGVAATSTDRDHDLFIDEDEERLLLQLLRPARPPRALSPRAKARGKADKAGKAGCTPRSTSTAQVKHGPMGVGASLSAGTLGTKGAGGGGVSDVRAQDQSLSRVASARKMSQPEAAVFGDVFRAFQQRSAGAVANTGTDVGVVSGAPNEGDTDTDDEADEEVRHSALDWARHLVRDINTALGLVRTRTRTKTRTKTRALEPAPTRVRA